MVRSSLEDIMRQADVSILRYDCPTSVSHERVPDQPRRIGAGLGMRLTDPSTS